ncbi:general odorant-binding protein 19d [Drosophila tropicalis]|uniref:general odorant-binding protein 19d n=1 Tax=Drosophila tropicalis TaxID=46794 RepID=UPI0035ABB1E0
MLRIVCLAFLLAIVAAKPHEEITKEHATEVAHECKEETGATDEDVAQLMKHELGETHEAKCLRSCIMKKFEIMDDAGKLNKEKALELVKIMSKDNEETSASVAEIVDKCDEIEVPEDHCDAAHAYETCIHEQIHEHGLSLEEH